MPRPVSSYTTEEQLTLRPRSRHLWSEQGSCRLGKISQDSSHWVWSDKTPPPPCPTHFETGRTPTER